MVANREGPNMRFAMATLLAVLLAGCFQTISAIEQYDACAAETSSFTAMAACGKERRTAYCQRSGNCSAQGNQVVQYADALALAVRNREMSEAEAMRRFAEFKMGVVTANNRDAAIVAAGAAASGPSTCV